jgi:hypothetical protein
LRRGDCHGGSRRPGRRTSLSPPTSACISRSAGSPTTGRTISWESSGRICEDNCNSPRGRSVSVGLAAAAGHYRRDRQNGARGHDHRKFGHACKASDSCSLTETRKSAASDRERLFRDVPGESDLPSTPERWRRYSESTLRARGRQFSAQPFGLPGSLRMTQAYEQASVRSPAPLGELRSKERRQTSVEKNKPAGRRRKNIDREGTDEKAARG